MIIECNKEKFLSEVFLLYVAIAIIVYFASHSWVSAFFLATIYIVIRLMMPRVASVKLAEEGIEISKHLLLFKVNSHRINNVDFKIYSSKRTFSVKSISPKKYIVFYSNLKKVCELREGQDGWTEELLDNIWAGIPDSFRLDNAPKAL